MKAILKYLLGLSLLVLAASQAAAASAAPVIVGSVNPATNPVTIFKDLLVKTFPDGSPIQHIHGRYNEATQEYLLVRAGRNELGECQTDAFQLARTSNNRLAISIGGKIAWNGIGEIRALAFCVSDTCTQFCRVVANSSTPHDLDDYACECSSNNGNCEATIGYLYKDTDIGKTEGLEG